MSLSTESVTQAAPRRQRRFLHRPRMPHGKLLAKRLVGIAIIFAVIWGLFWLLMVSPYGQALWDFVQPGYAALTALINDPLGVDWAGHLVAIGAVLISKIAFIMFILDEA